MAALVDKLRMRISAGFVLAFHDIDPDRLADLVDSLRPAQPIPLSDLIDRSKQGKTTSGMFAITVDDGVGDTVRNLSQLFRKRSWPGTFYISTNYVDLTEGMGFQWWRNLAPLLPRKKLSVKSGVLDLSLPGAVQKLSQQMEWMWHSQKLNSYLPLTIELAEIAAREHGLSIDSLQPPAPITWPEVTRMSHDGLIRFESHGVSHAAMCMLTDEELIFEMKYSRNLVSSHTGHPCRHFAYPFGSGHSIGSRAAAIAQKFYDSAATMALGSVEAANPWLLPRIPLYPKNPAWFAKLKILLKCNRLTGVPGLLEEDLRPAEGGAASLARKSAV